jgi:alkylation response protein AidB-like acyl-CoA dehydrogenase
MDFSLQWHQEELRRTAREFLAAAFPLDRLRAAEDSPPGYFGEVHQQMGQLGWLQLGALPKDGGTEDIVDLVVLYEALGRAAAPGPHFVSGFLATQILGRSAINQSQSDVLAQLGEGTAVVTVALYEDSAGYDAASVQLRARMDAGGVSLSGTKEFVPYVLGAQAILTLARTGDAPDDLTFVLVPTGAPGVQVLPLQTMGNDRLFRVSFADVQLPREALVGAPGGAWTTLSSIVPTACTLQAAELVGLSDMAFEMALDYARQRIAFGRPIGAFQAIQHKCADMVADRDAARFMTYQAACLLNVGNDGRSEVLMAKAFAAAAARRVTKESHQIFGGAGYILEHKVNFYYRRAKAIDLFLGNADWQLDRIADLIAA